MVQSSTGPLLHRGPVFFMVAAFAVSGVVWIFIWLATLNMKTRPEKSEANRTQAGVREDRFPGDEVLRVMGWRIKARPDKGEAVWEHVATGIRATFSRAMELVDEHEKTRPDEFK